MNFELIGIIDRFPNDGIELATWLAMIDTEAAQLTSRPPRVAIDPYSRDAVVTHLALIQQDGTYIGGLDWIETCAEIHVLSSPKHRLEVAELAERCANFCEANYLPIEEYPGSNTAH